MRAVVLNTGTELLLGDVRDAHLSFIAHEILSLGLRIDEQRTVPDGPLIRSALEELLPQTAILFVTGGLGPTTDDITRDMVADLLGLKLQQDPELLASLQLRLKTRHVRWTSRIARQADVPTGARILPNENGSAPGLYLNANINSRIPSPHLFLLPGPPRELQPMFRSHVMSILRSVVQVPRSDRRIYKIAGVGESIVEEAVGEKILAIPGIELGYCARPGEVDLRIIGEPGAIARADSIVQKELGSRIFTARGEALEEVLVKLLTERKQTISVAESCTGGLLANRLTNVSGSSAIFIAGYVAYANQAKIGMLGLDSKVIEKHGAVSEAAARALAEAARGHSGSTYGLSTTGIAGPTGGSAEKPVGTVFVGLAAPDETVVKKLFFPSDRETFKQIVAQAAFELLRRKLVDDQSSKSQAPNPRETSNHNT